MTIKNTKKNISDENGLVVVDVKENQLQIDHGTDTEQIKHSENFTNKFQLTLSFQDWENEDYWEYRENNETYQDDPDYKWNKSKNCYIKIIEFPANEIVRIAHLEKFYYNKEYMDNEYWNRIVKLIKLHYYIWPSTTPPTVAQVKQLQTDGVIESYDNYVFLVPFSSPDYNQDDDPETIQEGQYREFVYVKNGNQETMEEKGSIKIDLTPYLETEDLDNELENLSTKQGTHYKTEVIDKIETNRQNIEKKVDKLQQTANAFLVTNSSKNVTTSEKIGNIDINGILYSGTNIAKNKILMSNNSTGVINGIDYLTTNQIRSYSNINGIAEANITTQDDINQAFQTTLNNIESNFDDYLKLSDIKKEIWGEAPSRLVAKQNSEQNTTVKNYKLGDYIHYLLYDSGEFYTSAEIDALIQCVVNIQDNTLGML